MKSAEGIPRARLDPARIIQVFRNMPGKALYYSPEGGRVQVEVRRVADRVQIAIQDNPSGVSLEEPAHLFDRSYRADPCRAREDGGSGLGPAIARSIIETHKGRLWAESEKDNGLKVVIELPLV